MFKDVSNISVGSVTILPDLDEVPLGYILMCLELRGAIKSERNNLGQYRHVTGWEYPIYLGNVE